MAGSGWRLPFMIDWGDSSHPTDTLPPAVQLVAPRGHAPRQQGYAPRSTSSGSRRMSSLREGPPALRATIATPGGDVTLDKLSINSSMIDSGVRGCMNTSRADRFALERRRRDERRPAVQQVRRPSLPLVASPSGAAEQHDAELWPHDQFGRRVGRRAHLPSRLPARCPCGSLSRCASTPCSASANQIGSPLARRVSW